MIQKKSIRIDIIVILVIIAAGAVMALALFLSRKGGTVVQVSVDSKVIKEFDINTDTEYEIPGINGGTNMLVIENGEAYVRDASCPDGLCINMGHISKVGESVICLPNRVVVEITSDSTQESPAVDHVAG